MSLAKAPKKIQVEKWLIKDKISQYRGVLKLHARDKKLQQLQATKLKSVVSRKIASLQVDVTRHREIVSENRDDGKQHTLRLLGEDHRRFYLAFNHLKPSEIYAAIYQDYNLKRRFLDKLYYEKKRKLKQNIELQLEYNDLSTELEEQIEYLPECDQQQLIAKLQRSIAKYNAARDVYSTYRSMLNILKKDAIFFDTLLNTLKKNQCCQCKAMLKITVMGQLAAENLDDIRQKYIQMSQTVLRNMKIREKMLSTVNYQVKDLWAYAQSLVRVESVHIFAKKDIDVFANKVLENQIVHLENICTEVREVLLVHSYHDLLSRLENQSEHRKALLARFDINLKNRDVLLSKKNQAQQVLESLKHSTKTATEPYKINGMQDLLEQIEMEKKREKDLREQIKAHGELFTNIRAALQNMNIMLLCVRHGKGGAPKKLKNENKKESVNDKDDERDAQAEIEGMDTDVLVLLSKISRKTGILFNMSNFDLEQMEDEARDLYYTYVSNYNSDLIFGVGEEEQIGLLVEPEIIDISVLSRADIKYQTRQVLEAHLKPE